MVNNLVWGRATLWTARESVGWFVRKAILLFCMGRIASHLAFRRRSRYPPPIAGFELHSPAQQPCPGGAHLRTLAIVPSLSQHNELQNRPEPHQAQVSSYRLELGTFASFVHSLAYSRIQPPARSPQQCGGYGSLQGKIGL